MGTQTRVLEVARAFVKKRQGRLAHGERTVPETVVVRAGVRVSEGRLGLYRRVCELPRVGPLPTAYPEVLFLGAMARLVTEPSFPVSPLGLIHVRQTIVLHRPIPPTVELDLRCWVAGVEETGRGIEVRIAMDVRIGQDLVWEGSTTLLSRGDGKGRGTSKRAVRGEISAATPELVDVGRSVGLGYAAASGDFNPHHLFWWTARPLGYRRPIAHGMWTLAVILGRLEHAEAIVGPRRIEASFKRPLFIPGRAELFHREDERGIVFELREPGTDAPHVLGTLERLT